MHFRILEITSIVNSLKCDAIKVLSNKLDKKEHENIIGNIANGMANSIDLELRKYLSITEKDAEKLLPKLDKELLRLLNIGTNAIIKQDRKLLS